jgi:hypothetical protein
LDLLPAAHFPNSVVTERGVALAAACHAKGLDWWVAARIVTYQRVRWVILLPHIKVQVWTGYFQLYYKRDGRSLFLN